VSRAEAQTGTAVNADADAHGCGKPAGCECWPESEDAGVDAFRGRHGRNPDAGRSGDLSTTRMLLVKPAQHLVWYPGLACGTRLVVRRWLLLSPGGGCSRAMAWSRAGQAQSVKWMPRLVGNENPVPASGFRRGRQRMAGWRGHGQHRFSRGRAGEWHGCRALDDLRGWRRAGGRIDAEHAVPMHRRARHGSTE
jgi:hypothetical protein